MQKRLLLYANVFPVFHETCYEMPCNAGETLPRRPMVFEDMST